MITETQAFSKARLARLKDNYASAKAEGKEEFDFNCHKALVISFNYTFYFKSTRFYALDTFIFLRF
jgi:hypothetical protein